MGLTTQILGLMLGWLAIGWVALQSAASAIRTFKRRMRDEREYLAKREEFCRRVEATGRRARASKSIPDWPGWRPFRVAAVVDEAREVKSFYFAPVDGRPLSPFAPGQYLTFRLPVERFGSPLVRCYSLSDRPRQDYYRTTVKRIGAPAGRTDVAPRRSSSFFHDHVGVGDVLELRAPAGTFLLDPLGTEPIVLIGAGIGITPLLSMLEATLHGGRQREVYALFGFRSGLDHPFKAYLEKLAETCSWLHLHISYSAPSANDVQYKDFGHRGRITIERVRELLPSNNFRFYVCGPSALMESLVPKLWEWGVPESHVHFEAFGPASVKAAVGRSQQQRIEPCEVRFERTGRAVTWNGTFASLLEFGEAAGIVMPSGCRAGSCGECMMAIRNGSVMQIKQPSIPVLAGHCLTCISAPMGELVLDA